MSAVASNPQRTFCGCAEFEEALPAAGPWTPGGVVAPRLSFVAADGVPQNDALCAEVAIEASPPPRGCVQVKAAF